MKTLIPFSIIATVLLAGCGENSSNSSATNNVSTNNLGNPIAAPVNYLGAVMQAQRYSEQQIDLAYVNQAIQQFNAGEGHYPTNLQEMIPNYLGKMPQAPYGYKIVYDANTGTIKVVKQ
jgi:hypothetical protein